MDLEKTEAGREEDEQVLIKAARLGDHRAFAELVARYEGRLFRFLLARAGNREDAEDLLQITFVTAYRNLWRYRKRYRFSTWLFTIAYRRTIDRMRARCAEPREGEGDSSHSDSPVEVLQQREESGRLWSLARKVLSEKQHAVLWLRYGEDLTTGEIAAVTGLSQVYVKVLLHRARKILGEHLAGERADSRSEYRQVREVRENDTWIRNPLTRSV